MDYVSAAKFINVRFMQSRSFQAQTVGASEWGKAFVSQRFRPILFLETGDLKKVEPYFYFHNIVNNFQAQPKQTSDSLCWGGGITVPVAGTCLVC